jgi:hypothetical protein
LLVLEEQVQYIFRKPLWRKILPLFLLLLIWLIPLSYILVAASSSQSLIFAFLRHSVHILLKHGASLDHVLVLTALISMPILVYLYWGFEKLILTPDAIVRRLPFGASRSLKWVDVDEVLIEHIDVRFEGKQTAKKILKIFAVRRRFFPWRRYMRITNREFECYHHAERIAAQVSIPAIAARMRREILEKGKTAKFQIRETGDGLLSLLFSITAFALLPLWGLNRVWTPDTALYRPYVLAVAILLFLMALKKFLFRQVAMDQNNLYIQRRDWTIRSVPLDSIADVRVLDNRLMIFAKKRGRKKPVRIFKTKRFIRNRGVLLRLIRESRELREHFDATPIMPLRAITEDAFEEQDFNPTTPPVAESGPSVAAPGHSGDSVKAESGAESSSAEPHQESQQSRENNPVRDAASASTNANQSLEENRPLPSTY